MSLLTCSLCGADLVPAFAAVDRNRRLSDDTFTYHRCRTCRTLELRPVPPDLSRYYPPDYYVIPRDRAALLAGSEPERYKLDIVRTFVPGGRLVEIGPAFGAFAVVTQEAGYETSAIEMDHECCRFLRTAVGIPVQETDDPSGALAADAPFDVVAMWHVIEHLPNPRAVITAAASALRPGGILAIATPNPDSFQFRVLGRRWTHLDAPRHLFLIPDSQLARMGRERGLEVGLVTTSDRGSRSWNLFGWRESLAGFGSHPRTRTALRLGGSVLSRVMAPWDRRELRGSTYTLILRRPER